MLVLICLVTVKALAFYDPGVQRWVNRDPIQEDGGVNLHGFVGNEPCANVDPSGLVLKVDPKATPEFIERMRKCIEELINRSPTGRQLVFEAIQNPNTITIKPGDDAAFTENSFIDRFGSRDPIITMDPNTPNGVSPETQKLAEEKYKDEKLPNCITGYAVTLAHELGHAIHDYGETDNVPLVENPVRNDFNLPPRKKYRGRPIIK